MSIETLFFNRIAAMGCYHLEKALNTLGGSPRRRMLRFMRQRFHRNWSQYLAVRPLLRQWMIRERARGDATATLEPGYGFMSGVRSTDGSLLCAPRPEHPTQRDRRPRKVEKPYLPRLFRYPQGHEFEGRLVILKKSARIKRIRRSPAKR